MWSELREGCRTQMNEGSFSLLEGTAERRLQQNQSELVPLIFCAKALGRIYGFETVCWFGGQMVRRNDWFRRSIVRCICRHDLVSLWQAEAGGR